MEYDSVGPNGFPQIGHHASGPRYLKPEKVGHQSRARLRCHGLGANSNSNYIIIFKLYSNLTQSQNQIQFLISQPKFKFIYTLVRSAYFPLCVICKLHHLPIREYYIILVCIVLRNSRDHGLVPCSLHLYFPERVDCTCIVL